MVDAPDLNGTGYLLGSDINYQLCLLIIKKNSQEEQAIKQDPKHPPLTLNQTINFNSNNMHNHLTNRRNVLSASLLNINSNHIKLCTCTRLIYVPCSSVLTLGSTLMIKLEKLVSSRYLVKDMKLISGKEPTASLEAFHCLLNHFAPKMYSFSYQGQL